MVAYSIRNSAPGERRQQLRIIVDGGLEGAVGSRSRCAKPEMEALVSVAEALLQARKDRARFVPTELLGEPAWDIMVELFVAAGRGRQIRSADLCVDGISPSVTTRWMRVLENADLVKQGDGAGGPDCLFLTDRGFQSIRDYFAQRIDCLRPAPCTH